MPTARQTPIVVRSLQEPVVPTSRPSNTGCLIYGSRGTTTAVEEGTEGFVMPSPEPLQLVLASRSTIQMTIDISCNFVSSTESALPLRILNSWFSLVKPWDGLDETGIIIDFPVLRTTDVTGHLETSINPHIAQTLCGVITYDAGTWPIAYRLETNGWVEGESVDYAINVVVGADTGNSNIHWTLPG